MNDNTDITEVEVATKQDTPAPKVNYDEKGLTPGSVLNPTGKGGFADNPQNRSSGHWDKEESISYWYNKLLRMPDKEFEDWQPKNKAQRIAHNRIVGAIDMNIEGDDYVPIIRGFVIPTLPEDFMEDDIAAQAGEEYAKRTKAKD